MSSSPLPEPVASSAGLRASGRVRRQPETLYNSTPAGSSKRKRDDAQDADGDVEMPEDYISDEELPSEEDEPDEEELREKRVRARKAKAATPKKPPQKKAKVNGTTALPIRTAGGGRKRPPRKAKAVNTQDAEEAGGVFADVFAHGRDLQEVVRDWCEAFTTDESQALADVINFVLRAAGCKGTVTNHDIEDPDNATNKISDLQEEFQASNPTDYPLMAKTKSASTFKQGVTGFLEVFIKSIGQNGMLYERPELMENISTWFSTMSSASNRPFRHTATVVAMCIVDALCDVAKGFVEEVAKTRRHAESERKKARPNKDRIRQIDAKAKESSQILEALEVLIRDWYDTVFIHRYRDIDPTIRRECSASLGQWTITMPSIFFDSTHVRYLGWMLSDTAPAVRSEVVKQLTRLYKMPDMVGSLKTFTERFRSRIVEMATSDAETPVRSATIELLDILRESGLLEPDDIDTVGRLVFDSDQKVRKAVASFLGESVQEMYMSKLDDLGGEEALEEALPEFNEDNYEAPRLDWIKIKCLAEVLQAYDSEESLPSQIERSHPDGGLTYDATGTDSRFSVAADTLYDKVKELQDWRILSGYLLFDHSSGRANGVGEDPLSRFKHEATLSEREEMVLLEVLNASVKRSLGDAAEKIASTKTKLTKRDKERLQEDQEEEARDLASAIPKLLQKFGESPDTASAVLRLESIFNMPSLQGLQQDSATYGALLDDIKKQFMTHSSDTVLGPASNAILHAKSYGELDELTDEKIAGLWEDVVHNLFDLVEPATVSIRGVATHEELTALTNNLLRITRLSTVSDCSSILEEDVSETNVEEVPETVVEGEWRGDSRAPIDFIIALTRRAIPPESGTTPDPDCAVLEDEICARAAEAALFYFRWKLKSLAERLTTATAGDITYDELFNLAARRDRYGKLLEKVLSVRKPGEGTSVVIAGFLLDVYSSAAALKTIKPRPGMGDEYEVMILELEEEMERLVMKVFTAAEKNHARLSGRKIDEYIGDAGPPSGELEDDDPVNADPVSDPESEDEEDNPTQSQSQGQSQAFQQRKETKLMNSLVAERRFCELASKLILAALGGVTGFEPVRQRLELNRAKLGPNYKEVCAFLDAQGAVAKQRGKKNARGGAKAKSAANPKAKPVGKKNAKSTALVMDDEEEDEIEDDEAEEDQEALRRRGLVVDDPELEPERDEGAEGGADEESVLGD